MPRHPLAAEQLESRCLLARLFAISSGLDLYEIDPQDGHILNTLSLPPADDSGTALGFDGADLWYATPDNLYRLNPATGAIRQQWGLPNNVFRDGLAVMGGLIYLQESSVFETIDVFSPATGTIIETIDLEDANPLDAIPGFVSEGMAGMNGQLAITGTDLTNEEVLFIDPDTGEIVDRFPIDLDFSPSGLGVVGNEIHVGSAGDIVHVYSRNGTFLRDYTLDTFFDNVYALGGDGVGGVFNNNNLDINGTNDQAHTSTGSAVQLSADSILSNDNIEGFSLDGYEFVSVTDPDHGSVTINEDGDLVYDPEDYIGPIATFQYRAGEKLGETHAPDTTKSDWYGFSVDIDGITSVVGAPLHDSSGTNAGAVYIRDQDDSGQWHDSAKLTAADATANSQFGRAVAISGDTVVVGAWIDDENGTNAGAAYVFDRDADGNWSQSAKLMGSDTTASDYFGWTVDVSGDTVVVGAVYDDPVGSASGAAYVFERNQGGDGNWGEVTKLVASDASATDLFGSDVSVDLNTIVVGANYADDPVGDHAGTVYVFGRDTGGAGNWGEAQKIAPSDLAAHDQFGHSVSIRGDQLAIGSKMDDYDAGPFQSNAGSVYVYERDADSGLWQQKSKLYADDPTAGDHLGVSVSIDGGVVVAGATEADYGDYTDAGAAFVFQYDEDADDFLLVRKLADDLTGRMNDHLGVAVAVDGPEAIIGAHHGDSSTSLNGGTVHQLDLTMTTAYIQVIVLPPTQDPDPDNAPKLPVFQQIGGGDQSDQRDEAIDALSLELSGNRPDPRDAAERPESTDSSEPSLSDGDHPLGAISEGIINSSLTNDPHTFDTFFESLV